MRMFRLSTAWVGIIFFFVSSIASFHLNSLAKLSAKQHRELAKECGKQNDPKLYGLMVENNLTDDWCGVVPISPFHAITFARCLSDKNHTLLRPEQLHHVHIVHHIECLRIGYGPCLERTAIKHYVVPKMKYIRVDGFAVLEVSVTKKENRFFDMPCLPPSNRKRSANVTLLSTISLSATERKFQLDSLDYCASCGMHCSRRLKGTRLEGEKFGYRAGDAWLARNDGVWELQGITAACVDEAIDLVCWSDFICTHIGSCDENITRLSEPEAYYYDGEEQSGFDALGRPYDPTLEPVEERCTYGHYHALLSYATPLTRLSGEQYALLSAHCGQPLPSDGRTDGTERFKRYAVAVILTSTAKLYGVCTGFLITPMHVLTLMSCMKRHSGSTERTDLTTYVQYDIHCMRPGKYSNQSEIVPYECKDRPVNDSIVVNMMAPFCPPDDYCQKVFDVVVLETAKRVPLGSTKWPICIPKASNDPLELPATRSLSGFGQKRSSIYAHAFGHTNWSYSATECYEESCLMKMLNNGTQTRAAYDNGASYTATENGREYLYGIVTHVMTKQDEKVQHLTVTNIQHLLGFLCLAVGICPNGDTDIDVSRPFLSPAVSTSKGMHYLPSQMMVRFTRHHMNVFSLESHMADGAGVIRKVLESVPALRTRFSKEENDELQKRCGKLSGQAMRIHNGEPIDVKVHPWFAHVFRKQHDKLNTHCSGAFISPFHVITSQHCVEEEDKHRNKFDKWELIVGYGSDCYVSVDIPDGDLTRPEKTGDECPGELKQKYMSIANIITLRNDNGSVYQHERVVADFAILELEGRVEVDFLCLPKHNATYEEEMLRLGSGKDLSNKWKMGRVQHMKLTPGQGNTYYQRSGTWKIDEQHATEPVMGTGDSGGPVIRTTADGRKVLWAVMSTDGQMHDDIWKTARTEPVRCFHIKDTNLVRQVPFICRLTGICPDSDKKQAARSYADINRYAYCAWEHLPDEA